MLRRTLRFPDDGERALGPRPLAIPAPILRLGRLILVSVMLDVHFRGFACVVHGVLSVPLSSVGMVGRFFVSALFMMVGGLMVMSCCMLMVFSCFPVMCCCFFLHRLLLYSTVSSRFC